MKKIYPKTIDVVNDISCDPTFAAVVAKEEPVFHLAWKNPKFFNSDGTRKDS